MVWKYKRRHLSNKTKFKIFVIIFAVLIWTASGVIKYRTLHTDETIEINAESAIILEKKSGNVLYEKNADERLQPASTVKVMTAMVALDNLKVNDKIIPTETVLTVEPTSINLKPGAEYTFKDLISAILIKSANDAAVAIAEGVSGDEKDFAVLMNEKAAKIGMENTNFTCASGLPADPRSIQYSTSRDLAKMMRYALKYGPIMDNIGIKELSITSGNGHVIQLNTHNRSLFSKENACWGKTGYTRVARRTFVGIDPSYRPKIIIAIMKSDDLWNDIAKLKKFGLKTYNSRYRTVLDAILDWIFNV